MASLIEDLCRDKGLRITGPRRIIAQVLSDSDDHPDAEELHRRASAVDDRISIATVYRTLRLFEEVGILERHDFRDGRARYETLSRGEGHHHHIINIRTGEVTEFEDEQLEAIKRGIAANLGFRIVGERLELYCVPVETDDDAA